MDTQTNDEQLDAQTLFDRAVRQATAVVMQVGPDDFDWPTPDEGWDVRTLVHHMLYELRWTADLVQGRTVQDVGDEHEGDIIGTNLAGNWQEAAQAALAAVGGADMEATAHLSYGNVTVREYLQEAASDQLVHAWDLGTALAQPVRLDIDAVRTVYQLTLPKLDRMAASGLFATPLEVPDTADMQDRLLGLYGRDASLNKA